MTTPHGEDAAYRDVTGSAVPTATSRATPARAQGLAPQAPGGVHTLRRVILFILLGVLVSVAAGGLAGLLDLLLDPGTLDGREYALAAPLASAIIATPLGAVVFVFVWRGLQQFHDRHSTLWPVYLAVFGTIALLIALFSVLAGVETALRGGWVWGEVATAIAWGAVWVWHLWMWRATPSAPTRLASLTPALGTLVGLGFGLAGGISLLEAVLSEALLGSGTRLAETGPWTWVTALLPHLAWFIAGFLVWALHWVVLDGRRRTTGFAGFVLVFIAGFIAVAITLGGLTSALHSLQGLAFGIDGATDVIRASRADLLRELAAAIGATLFGSLVWAYHRQFVRAAGVSLLWSARLVASGVALVFAASGFGVIVNALLSTLAVSLGRWDERSLLFGGIAALVAGGVAWWLLWGPTQRSEWATFGGRRAYLVVVFGASALVAVITLLVITTGVIRTLVGDPLSGSMVEEIRAPLGLLAATALVAIYHFAVWRRERTDTDAAPEPIPHDTAGPASDDRQTPVSVSLITDEEPTGLVRAIHELGATVSTVLTVEPTSHIAAAETLAEQVDTGTDSAGPVGTGTEGTGTGGTAVQTGPTLTAALVAQLEDLESGEVVVLVRNGSVEVLRVT